LCIIYAATFYRIKNGIIFHEFSADRRPYAQRIYQFIAGALQTHRSPQQAREDIENAINDDCIKSAGSMLQNLPTAQATIAK